MIASISKTNEKCMKNCHHGKESITKPENVPYVEERNNEGEK